MNGGTYQFFIIPFEAPEARDQGSESPACRQSPKKPRKKAAYFRRPTNLMAFSWLHLRCFFWSKNSPFFWQTIDHIPLIIYH